MSHGMSEEIKRLHRLLDRKDSGADDAIITNEKIGMPALLATTGRHANYSKDALTNARLYRPKHHPRAVARAAPRNLSSSNADDV